MGELKTQKTKASVAGYIKIIKDEQQRKDSGELVKIFKAATGASPAMWGDSIIGFGLYHYESERSAQKGDWFLAGFAPRKGYLSIYIMSGFGNYKPLLKKLGKHKVSSGCCLYIKRLSDIDVKILEKLIKDSVKEMKKRYGVN